VNDTPASTSTLRWAVRLIALHALCVLGVAVLFTYGSFTQKGMSTASVVATPLIFFFFAAVFAGLAVALHQMRGWARAPSIVLEMLLVPIGWYFVSAGVPAVGIPVVLTGIVGAGLLLAPSTREALGLNR
jgi:hypothetical protein